MLWNLAFTKLASYDGTTSYSIYNMLFKVTAEDNGWGSRGKMSFLVASVCSSVAAILQTLPKEKLLDSGVLVSSLDLHFRSSFLWQPCVIQLRNGRNPSSLFRHRLVTSRYLPDRHIPVSRGSATPACIVALHWCHQQSRHSTISANGRLYLSMFGCCTCYEIQVTPIF